MPAKIPDLHWGNVSNGDDIQLGCVYCLGGNLHAPSAKGVVYLWQGTSVCGEHLREVVSGGANG